MRFVCVWVPCFYIQVERLRTPGLREKPVVIGGRPEERGSVIDCSPEALSRGVCPSMPLSQAYSLCPEARFILFEKDPYEELWENILLVLGAFSLRIESDRCGLACLGLAGPVRRNEISLADGIVRTLAGSFGLQAKAGVGNARFLAEQAASHAKQDVLVIRAGEEKAFLSSLPVKTLPVGEDVKERLALLGLKTLGRIASLSREALLSQFGLQGNLLCDLASGLEDRRPIPLRKRGAPFEEEMISDVPLEDLSLLRSCLADPLDRLAAELKQAQRLCRKLKLLLHLDGGGIIEKTIVFKRPTGEAGEMQARIRNILDHTTVRGAVRSVQLQIPEVSFIEAQQEDLFRRRPDFSTKLEGVKDYLVALYGYTPLFRIEEDNPDSRLPERRFVFREV